MIASKATILCLYEILKKYTDESHILSAEKIREKLKSIYDVDMERRAIYRNIEALRSMGIEIAGYQDNREGYFLIDREFELSEIRLLCDAVAASDMIKESTSKIIIKKLLESQSIFQSRMLQKTVFVKSEKKILSKQLFYNIDALNVAPTYVTDALVRKVNVDRYDDREIIKTNLIESYSQLLDFGRKNLPDKFFLEDTVNKSLRNTIIREMISNTLMHREFTSSYTAKFVIEKDRMYVENANRATKEGFITVDNLEPNPKNPLIASFFRNIGYADQLGSGVRKLFKYSKYYSGKDPLFVEDDVFRIIVPLDDAYSFDYGIEAGSSKVIEINNADKMPINADKMPINAGKTLVNSLSAQQNSIIQFAKETGSIKSRQVEELLGVKQRRARRILGELVNMGILERQGAYKSTVYVLKN